MSKVLGHRGLVARGLPAWASASTVSLVALLLALVGQQVVLGREAVWAGGLLLVVGAALFGMAGSLAPAPALAPGQAPTSAVTAPERDAADLDDPSAGGAVPAEAPRVSLIGGPLGLLTLLAVTLAAAAFRLVLLDTLPPGLAAGEARLGLDAAGAVADGWSAPNWNGWPVFHLLSVGTVNLLGKSTLAVRLPAAMGGILFAPALFLLGRQLGGAGVGMAAGALGAVAFWHVDATRGAWGYAGWGVACEAFGLALLVHGFRHRNALSTAVAGLAFGLALQVSWGALAALGYGAVWVAWAWYRHLIRPQAAVALGGPLLVYLLIASGPVLVGVSAPDRRLPNETIVEASAPRDPLAVARSLALAFNVYGDADPRHNLAGEPMLDRVTAPLFVLGLGLAVAGLIRGIVRVIRRRRATPAAASTPEPPPARPLSPDTAIGLAALWLLGALIAAAMAPGVVESPDAIATLHVLAPALLLAAGALVVLAAGGPSARIHASIARLDLTLVLLALVIGVNWHTTFVRRPNDQATWMAFSAPEAMAAREIRPLLATHWIYLADVWLDHPTIRFLVPDLTAPRRLDPATTLPFIRNDAFAYFAPGRQGVVTDDLERLYEDGEIDRFRSPIDDTIVMRSFRADARDVAEARGVTVRVANGARSRSGRMTLDRFRFEWPRRGEDARTASVELYSAVVVPREGWYTLRLDGPSASVLELNGAVLANAQQDVSAYLARGPQSLRVAASVEGPTTVEVRWAPPGTADLVPLPSDRLYRDPRAAGGMVAYYREGADSSGEPSLTRVERYLQRSGTPPPLDRPYTVDWVGIVDAPTNGTYRFRLESGGLAGLWIDDRPVARGVRGDAETATVVMDEGDHRIRVRLVDDAPPTRFNLLWAPPGDDLAAIPTSRLRPPLGDVVAAIPGGTDAGTDLRPLGQGRIRWLVTTDGEPSGVAVAPDGGVLVIERRGGPIRQVVGDGRGLADLADPDLGTPSDIEIDADGRIWVLDAQSGRIVRLEADGTSPTVVVSGGHGLYRPRGLGLARDGSLYVADTGGNRVVHLAADGRLLGQIGPEIGGPRRLRQPTDVLPAPDGAIIVVNGEGGDVIRLTPDGRYVTHWDVLSSDTERGAHLALGPDSSLWISEPEGRRIRRFTLDGEPAGVVDQTREGRLLRMPVGLAIDSAGTLFVTDVSLRAVLAISIPTR